MTVTGRYHCKSPGLGNGCQWGRERGQRFFELAPLLSFRLLLSFFELGVRPLFFGGSSSVREGECLKTADMSALCLYIVAAGHRSLRNAVKPFSPTPSIPMIETIPLHGGPFPIAYAPAGQKTPMAPCITMCAHVL